MGGTEGESDHDNEGGNLPLWTVKLFAALLMAAVCAAGCLLPVVVAAQARKPRPQQQSGGKSTCSLLQALLSLINCFAAGAFLGLAVIHLLPEAVLQLQRDGYLLVVRTGGGSHSPGDTHTYNIAYALATVGFTAMLALEQFLAGGHAHCQRDSPASQEAKVVGETASLALLPSSADASGCRSSVESSALLQHSSHHHAQHHLLCTSANYCPGCDDCAEAATAAPPAAPRGEGPSAETPALSSTSSLSIVAPVAAPGAGAQAAAAAVRGRDLEEAGDRLLATEKDQSVILSSLVNAQEPGLYKVEEQRTLSQETANTSIGCSNSMQKNTRGGVGAVAYSQIGQSADESCIVDSYGDMLGKEQKREESTSAAVVVDAAGPAAAFSTTGSTDKESPTAYGVSGLPFPEEQSQGGPRAAERENCNKASRADSDAARIQMEVHCVVEHACASEVAVVVTAPASHPTALVAAAVASEKKQKQRAAPFQARTPQLLRGLLSRREVGYASGRLVRGRGLRGRVSSGTSSRRKDYSSGSNGKSYSSTSSGNGWGYGRRTGEISSENRKWPGHFCRSSTPLRSPENRNALVVPISHEDGQRGSKTTGPAAAPPGAAAATPDATEEASSSSAGSHGKCGCRNKQTALPVTACCCSGCCKKCRDHSHDPESGARVHSGSMGANVQGGDSAVEQQRVRLDGSRGRPSAIRAFASGPGQRAKNQESTENTKGTEGDFQMVSISLSSKTALSLAPLSTQSYNVECCGGCCNKDESAARPHEGKDLDSVKKLHRRRQSLLESVQHGHATVVVAVPPEDGEGNHMRRHRILGWMGCFDPAKWSLTLALGVHAIFEGVILGTTVNSQDVWIAMLAILGHKAAEGVALSSTLLRLPMTRANFIVLLTLFVLTSPVGVFLGAVAAMGGAGVCGIFNALAVGAVLYATNEMLSEFAGRCSRVRRVLKLVAFTLGLGLLLGLDLLHAPFCHQRHGGGHAGHLHDHH